MYEHNHAGTCEWERQFWIQYEIELVKNEGFSNMVAYAYAKQNHEVQK